MRFRVLGAGLMVIAALALAACGSSSDDSDDNGSSGGASAAASGGGETEQYAKTVADLQKGQFTPPPTSGPPATKGKKVWFISCGQLYEACATGAAAFKEAAAELGWDATIVDGKADPSVASGAIRQAVAAGVDGVALVAFDCPAIKSALQEAKKADMPVVQSFSFDCGDPGVPGEPLFASGLKMKGLDLPDFRTGWGKARAEYTIAKTDGKAKVIDLNEQTQYTTKAVTEGYESTLAECDTCELVEGVKFTFADVPNGTFTQKVLAALQQHPEANVLSVPADSFFGIGVTQALRQSGRAGKITVVGGEGFAPNIDLIRKGIETAALAYDYSWAAYGMADVLNRILAGESTSDIPDEGGGWQLVDADHNLPAEGERWVAPIDYKAAYQKIWTP